MHFLSRLWNWTNHIVKFELFVSFLVYTRCASRESHYLVGFPHEEWDFLGLGTVWAITRKKQMQPVYRKMKTEPVEDFRLFFRQYLTKLDDQLKSATRVLCVMCDLQTTWDYVMFHAGCIAYRLWIRTKVSPFLIVLSLSLSFRRITGCSLSVNPLQLIGSISDYNWPISR